MIHYHHDINQARAPFNWNLFRRLFSYATRNKRKLILAALLALLGTAANVVQPILVQRAIDEGIGQNQTDLLVTLSGVYLALSLLENGALGLQIWLMSQVGQGVFYNLRMDLFRKMQNLSMDYHDRTISGSIISRFTSDITSLNDILTEGLVSTITDLVLVFGAFAVMMSYSWQLALATLVIVPVMVFGAGFFRVRAARSYRRVRALMSETNANLAESILGIRVTQTFSREHENSRLFGKVTEETLQAHKKARMIGVSVIPGIDLLLAISVAIVLTYGGNLVLGDNNIELGVITAFLIYLQRLFHPLQELGTRFDLLQAAMASGERVTRILDTPVTVLDRADAQDIPHIKGKIKYSNVHFEYLPDEPVINGIAFDVNPGNTLALVGATGAGKSTIINLLFRFYDINKGSIEIDGIDIRKVTQQSLRSKMALVLQDPFLFKGTIRENIAYGNPDASNYEIEEAAKAVHLHDTIMNMDFGYDTSVAERGGRLSMGQRQLVSFARALLTNPQILVLDEATSSVDTQTEALVQQALETLLENRTAIVIAHRLSTVRMADEILVLDAGKIIERGTHSDLVSAGGHYQRMHELGFDLSDEDIAERLQSGKTSRLS
tara:strand:- start:1171 stop:2997 length:1827 start_codon:yes stop_codon:yes gene_type:complete